MAEHAPTLPYPHRVAALLRAKENTDRLIFAQHRAVMHCCPKAALPHEYCTQCRARNAAAEILEIQSDKVQAKLEALGAACAKCHEVIVDGVADADRLCARCAPLTCEGCKRDLRTKGERMIGACTACWHRATGTAVPDAL